MRKAGAIIVSCLLATTVISISMLISVSHPGNRKNDREFPEFTYPTGLSTYYDGPLSIASVISGLGAPASAIRQISTSDIGSLPNESLFIVSSQVIETGALSVNTTGHMIGQGDLIMVYAPNSAQDSSLEHFLGQSWAREFNSSVMIMPPIIPSNSGNLIVANGASRILKMASLPLSTGFSKTNFLLRIDSWRVMIANPAISGTNNGSTHSTTDLVTFTNNNLPPGTVLFLTGQTVGYNNSYGEYWYDLGIWCENKIVPYGSNLPGTYEIPVATMGWIKFIPTRNMTSQGPGISYLEGNINYDSSYTQYQGGGANSYLYDIESTSPSSTSGVHSYTLGASFDGITPNPYFQMTYTPPSSTVSVKFTDFGYTDTPQSEDNYGWQFTYGQTVANGAYADGYTALGEWILTAGLANNNTAIIGMTQQVKASTSSAFAFGSEVVNYELLTLSGSFALYYYPPGISVPNFYTSGGY